MIDPYDLALFALGALLVLIAVALLWRRMRARVPAAPPYAVKDEILTWEERALVPLLDQALGDEFRVFSKIRMEDLLQPTATSAKKRRRALEVLEGRTVPFLICRADDFSPVAAIAPGEGGASPYPELSDCGIEVLQFSATSLPRPHDIRAELDRLFSESGEKERTAEDEETVGEGDDWRIGSHFPSAQEEGGWLDGLSQSPPAAEVKEEKKESLAKVEDSPLLCPQCGRVMTRRRMVRGPHAGRELWVCANFPACRKTVPVLHD